LPLLLALHYLVILGKFRPLRALEQLERALLRLVPRLYQVLQRLLTQSMLLTGNDATLARLHQILLLQTTGSVLGRAMEYLRLGSYRRHLARLASALASLHHHIT